MRLTVDDLVVGLTSLSVAGNTRAGVAVTTALARVIGRGVGRVGGVEPEHVGVVLGQSM